MYIYIIQNEVIGQRKYSIILFSICLKSNLIYNIYYIYTVKLSIRNLFIRTFFTHLVGIQPFPH